MNVIPVEKLRDQVKQFLTFKELVSAKSCNGADCLMEKLHNHKAHERSNHYHSLLLNQYVRSVPAGIPLQRGYMFVVLAADGTCSVAYSHMDKDNREGHRNGCLIHAEILWSSPSSKKREFCNYLLYVQPERGLTPMALAVCTEVPEDMRRIPWEEIFTDMPWFKKRDTEVPTREAVTRSPASHRVAVLNDHNSQDNPMRYFLWMHSALSFLDPKKSSREQPDIVGTMQELASKPYDPIVGSAMYEIHVVDAFTPRKAEELTQAVAEFATQREQICADDTTWVKTFKLR